MIHLSFTTLKNPCDKHIHYKLSESDKLSSLSDLGTKGTSKHIEWQPPLNFKKEEEVIYEVNDEYTIVGIIDAFYQDKDNIIFIEYKSGWSFRWWWIDQVEFYAWLIAKSGKYPEIYPIVGRLKAPNLRTPYEREWKFEKEDIERLDKKFTQYLKRVERIRNTPEDQIRASTNEFCYYCPYLHKCPEVQRDDAIILSTDKLEELTRRYLLRCMEAERLKEVIQRYLDTQGAPIVHAQLEDESIFSVGYHGKHRKVVDTLDLLMYMLNHGYSLEEIAKALCPRMRVILKLAQQDEGLANLIHIQPYREWKIQRIEKK